MPLSCLSTNDMAKRTGDSIEPEAKKARVLERHIAVLSWFSKDQDEGKKWLEEKLGFEVGTDATFPGDDGKEMRWLSLRYPGQKTVELAVEPVQDSSTDLVGTQVGDAVLFVRFLELHLSILVPRTLMMRVLTLL